ncbi:hypothetical protein VF_A0267 [Aliivibrio fischeri ES114]|uniref:DUF5666 domain-containing protein n=1 Tax=Aliivibrio fischeri (strain ATCC 700601 / ES114) TaxID=312309 RepID=Q5E0V9_ALIF1|nr:DUF5666 domain-containing protein [Aliivibrio fischeri]AAW87337.1 hypothetical protein VF_A0267 [Aliivibrio fischeri ES114]KLU78023.1 hypothetical protein AB192_14940 [Aliivibrio fischeri]
MKKVAVLLLGSMVLTGCGSDESSDSHASSTYMGEIESVNAHADSMTVNAMPLSLSSAQIELNGHRVSSSELEIGMQVDVEYDDDIAYEVDIDPEIVGIVSEVTANTIKVNGQVLNTAKDFTVNNFKGKRVMLFGYADQNGNWTINSAYEIGSIPVQDLYEGKITSTPTLSSFNIGTMNINYSNADIDSDELHKLKQGVWVEIEGSYDETSKVFTAYDVDVEDDLDLANAEVEGYVTALNHDKTLMTLNGKTDVVITENTRFEDGIKDELKIGSRVDVDLINNAGQLQASEIEFD